MINIIDHQWTKVLEPVNQIIKLDKINFSSFHAFTVAFYIYPYNFSMGNIILIGDADSLRMEQTYSNGRLYQSEVTVYFDDQQLTRAHVLLPETWTFLTLAFNGTITLWRNGEIMSFNNTSLTSLDAHQLQIGSATGQLFAEVAALQLYDRALNEAEIKLAMSQPPIFTSKRALFEMLGPFKGFSGQILQKGVTRTYGDCSRMCLRCLCCDAFRFGKNDHVCILISNHVVIDNEEMNFDTYRLIAQYPPLLNRKVICFDQE
ncbi:uncharacterized protein LOC117101069 isoform X1 [Anneissia japonica]|uniref:uncharacterized protein LOC117101069 isoform X1 n=1 Tax=Anneissia japonica TaxID=1529436 RepID=UPI0014255787|nr:uncharacterized protein LOC117101069 isoform X1 [Anneissia japonica]